MLRPLLILCLITLSACDTHTTSGAAYQAAGGQIDPEIAAAAAIEPNLHFPARIGIARISGRKITLPGPDETAVLQRFQTAAAGLGSFTTITPLLADADTDRLNSPTRRAQLAAATQHLDYLLIYKLDRSGGRFDGLGIGQALFLDVRNGYVYGSINTSTDVTRLGRTRTGWGRFTLSDRAATKLVTDMQPQVTEMLNALAAAQN